MVGGSDQEIYDRIKTYILSFHPNQEDILNINYAHLNANSKELAQYLLEVPEMFLAATHLAREDQNQQNPTHAIITNAPDNTKIKLTNLRSKYLNKLITLEGNIITKSAITTHITGSKFECPQCGSIMVVKQETNNLKEPNRCSCGRKGKFRLLDSTHEDKFTITLEQTTPDINLTKLEVECGEIFLDKTFEDTFTPGNHVRLTGILKPQHKSNRNGSQPTKITKHIIACNAEVIESAEQKSVMQDYDFLFNTLTPKMFEELIARLFRKKGYTAKTTPYVGDRGIDVIAVKGAERIAIQCKKNAANTRVDNDTVQRSIGAALSPHKSNKVMVITTSEDFTPGAYDQKQGSSIPCELWARQRVIAELGAFLDGTEEGWKLYNSEQEKEEQLDPFFRGYSHDEGEIDIDKISGGVSAQQRNKIIIIKEIINELIPKVGRTVPIEDIVEEAEKEDLTEKEVEEIIQKLKRSGDLFEPHRGFIAKI